MSEFDLIKRYFHWHSNDPQQVVGNGDDAAVLAIPEGYELVVSVDTSNENIHFPDITPAYDVGYKSLAVNLSDMAAMGAQAKWFTLSVSLPQAKDEWVSEFARGLKDLAQAHDVHLIGGDTTRGTLSIAIQIMGLVPKGKALLRSHAKEGDLVCVTGTLGDAAAGLALVQDRLHLEQPWKDFCISRLNQPTPRNNLIEALREHAHACMDLSDGLQGDAQHIANASQLGIEIDADQLPLSDALRQVEKKQAYQWATSGGDDYELLFTLPEANLESLLCCIKKLNIRMSVIGRVTSKINGVYIKSLDSLHEGGYDHFR